jgi:hypothetical protein
MALSAIAGSTERPRQIVNYYLLADGWATTRRITAETMLFTERFASLQFKGPVPYHPPVFPKYQSRLTTKSGTVTDLRKVDSVQPTRYLLPGASERILIKQ